MRSCRYAHAGARKLLGRSFFLLGTLGLRAQARTAATGNLSVWWPQWCKPFMRRNKHRQTARESARGSGIGQLQRGARRQYLHLACVQPCTASGWSLASAAAPLLRSSSSPTHVATVPQPFDRHGSGALGSPSSMALVITGCLLVSAPLPKKSVSSRCRGFSQTCGESHARRRDQVLQRVPRCNDLACQRVRDGREHRMHHSQGNDDRMHHPRASSLLLRHRSNFNYTKLISIICRASLANKALARPCISDVNSAVVPVRMHIPC